jgi:hypothetical protein
MELFINICLILVGTGLAIFIVAWIITALFWLGRMVIHLIRRND